MLWVCSKYAAHTYAKPYFTGLHSFNNVIPFLESEGYIRFEKGTSATSKAIYNVYCKWCEENAEKPMSSKTVLGYMKQNSEELGIEPSTNIPIDGGKKGSWFQGYLYKDTCRWHIKYTL